MYTIRNPKFQILRTYTLHRVAAGNPNSDVGTSFESAKMLRF